jgi:hypothetical protein
MFKILQFLLTTFYKIKNYLNRRKNYIFICLLFIKSLIPIKIFSYSILLYANKKLNNMLDKITMVKKLMQYLNLLNLSCVNFLFSSVIFFSLRSLSFKKNVLIKNL